MSKSIDIKWFPPAWVQIKTEGTVIYIDPAYMKTYFEKYPKRVEFSKWPDAIDGLPEELEKGDIILVTHEHSDHVKSVTVNRLKNNDTLVVAPKKCVDELGKKIKVVKSGDEINHKGVKIKVIPAYNTEEGSSTMKFHHRGECVGYLVDIDGRTIYHAGDTDFIPEMKKLGKVNVALLPVGGTYTMDIKEAVETALAIKPDVVIPIHHLRADPRKFTIEVEKRSDIKAVFLETGGVYGLK